MRDRNQGVLLAAEDTPDLLAAGAARVLGARWADGKHLKVGRGARVGRDAMMRIPLVKKKSHRPEHLLVSRAGARRRVGRARYERAPRSRPAAAARAARRALLVKVLQHEANVAKAAAAEAAASTRTRRPTPPPPRTASAAGAGEEQAGARGGGGGRYRSLRGPARVPPSARPRRPPRPPRGRAADAADAADAAAAPPSLARAASTGGGGKAAANARGGDSELGELLAAVADDATALLGAPLDLQVRLVSPARFRPRREARRRGRARARRDRPMRGRGAGQAARAGRGRDDRPLGQHGQAALGVGQGHGLGAPRGARRARGRCALGEPLTPRAPRAAAARAARRRRRAR